MPGIMTSTMQEETRMYATSPDWYHWFKLVVLGHGQLSLTRLLRITRENLLESPPFGRVPLNSAGAPVYPYDIFGCRPSGYSDAQGNVLDNT